MPVYGTRFTLALLRPRLEEAGVDGGPARGRARRRARRRARPRRSRPSSTRSPTPSPTPAASPSPRRRARSSTPATSRSTRARSPGRGFDLARVEALGRRGVRLLLSDSTNSERPGSSLSEAEVGAALEEAFERAPGRVFVACFASNIHRIQQVANAARAFGRRLALLGRAMESNVRIAQALGYLDVPAWMPVGFPDARELPPREVCVLTTGTQGEPRSALARLARGEHPDLALAPGDLVVLSSRFIPGNEVAVGEVVNALCRRGAQVAYEGLRPLHVSGHAQEAEQRRLIALARPGALRADPRRVPAPRPARRPRRLGGRARAAPARGRAGARARRLRRDGARRARARRTRLHRP